jgi:hypothetical protein
MLRLELRLYACKWHVDYLNHNYGATYYAQKVIAIRDDKDSPVVALENGGEYVIGIGSRGMVSMTDLDMYLKSSTAS